MHSFYRSQRVFGSDHRGRRQRRLRFYATPSAAARILQSQKTKEQKQKEEVQEKEKAETQEEVEEIEETRSGGGGGGGRNQGELINVNCATVRNLLQNVNSYYVSARWGCVFHNKYCDSSSQFVSVGPFVRPSYVIIDRRKSIILRVVSI